MDKQDFAGLGLIGLFLFCPLVSIYLTLKFLNWNNQKKLLSDSWFVWLSLLISAFLTAILTNGFINFPTSIFVLFISNISIAGITLSWLGKAKKAVNIFNSQGKKSEILDIRKIWTAATAVSFVTIFTVLVLLSLIFGIGSLMDKVSPKTEPSFEIYDI